MAHQWYYAQGGERKGPVSDQQLKELAASGELSPDDAVWAEGMGRWVKARSISGLFLPKSATPPPLPIPKPPVSTATPAVPPIQPARSAEAPPPPVAPVRSATRINVKTVIAIVVVALGLWRIMSLGLSFIVPGDQVAREKSSAGTPLANATSSSKGNTVDHDSAQTPKQEASEEDCTASFFAEYPDSVKSSKYAGRRITVTGKFSFYGVHGEGARVTLQQVHADVSALCFFQAKDWNADTFKNSGMLYTISGRFKGLRGDDFSVIELVECRVDSAGPVPKVSSYRKGYESGRETGENFVRIITQPNVLPEAKQVCVNQARELYRNRLRAYERWRDIEPDQAEHQKGIADGIKDVLSEAGVSIE